MREKLAFIGVTKIMIIIVTMTFSCATPYKKDGLFGGYAEHRLAKDTYLIKFRANAFTDVEVAASYALRRVGEFGKEMNYKYFTIIQTGESSAVVPLYFSSLNSNVSVQVQYGFITAIRKPIVKVIVRYFRNKDEVELFLKNNPGAKIYDLDVFIDQFQ